MPHQKDTVPPVQWLGGTNSRCYHLKASVSFGCPFSSAVIPCKSRMRQHYIQLSPISSLLSPCTPLWLCCPLGGWCNLIPGKLTEEEWSQSLNSSRKQSTWILEKKHAQEIPVSLGNMYLQPDAAKFLPQTQSCSCQKAGNKLHRHGEHVMLLHTQNNKCWLFPIRSTYLLLDNYPASSQDTKGNTRKFHLN